jgi:hypothetical protein
MNLLKPPILLLMAATVVILASRPLARTDWGAELRASRAASRAATAPQRAHRKRDFLTPLAKELLFMGIPGTMLVIVLRLKNRRLVKNR